MTCYEMELSIFVCNLIETVVMQMCYFTRHQHHFGLFRKYVVSQKIWNKINFEGSEYIYVGLCNHSHILNKYLIAKKALISIFHKHLRFYNIFTSSCAQMTIFRTKKTQKCNSVCFCTVSRRLKEKQKHFIMQ